MAVLVGLQREPLRQAQACVFGGNNEDARCTLQAGKRRSMHRRACTACACGVSGLHACLQCEPADQAAAGGAQAVCGAD
eukprot:6145098-Pyramimonas_sp.AAC.1